MRLSIKFKAGWILLVSLACLTGCQTTDQGRTGQMASVEISGHTKSEIQKATVAVFLANGYAKADGLAFEKKGSAWDTLNYGGWSENQAWIKMRVDIISTDTGKYTLGCDAYAVEGHGESGMEMERKFLFAKRSECKKLLEAVKATLDARPSPPAPQFP